MHVDKFISIYNYDNNDNDNIYNHDNNNDDKTDNDNDYIDNNVIVSRSVCALTTFTWSKT